MVPPFTLGLALIAVADLVAAVLQMFCILLPLCRKKTRTNLLQMKHSSQRRASGSMYFLPGATWRFVVYSVAVAPFRVRNILPKDTRDQLILTASEDWPGNLFFYLLRSLRPSGGSQHTGRLPGHHMSSLKQSQPAWTITACE